MEKKITVIPGDGIGTEVVEQGLRVLDRIEKVYGHRFERQEALAGGAALDATGLPLPAETLEKCKASDAVLLGALGGPKWDSNPPGKKPENGLLGLRAGLGLYANLRPARIYPALANASTLKREVVEGVDLLIVRELTGGIYFGKPRGISKEGEEEVGINTEIYRTSEIRRIAKVGFEAARKRRRKLISVDKANVLEASQLWRRVVIEVGKDFPDVELSHLYVDNCAMQLIANPKQFDVVVTSNLFRRHLERRSGHAHRLHWNASVCQPGRQHRDVRAGPRQRSGHRREKYRESHRHHCLASHDVEIFVRAAERIRRGRTGDCFGAGGRLSNGGFEGRREDHCWHKGIRRLDHRAHRVIKLCTEGSSSALVLFT